MKLSALLMSLTCCVMVSTGSLAQTEKKPARVDPAPATPKAVAPAQPADPSAEMEMWAKVAAPNEHHKHLEALVGVWDANVKTMYPGAPAEESKGTMRSVMQMGGRFLQSRFEGSMMGEAFTGVSTMGYNNLTKQYESTWRDSMSTPIYMTTGQCDAAGKVFTQQGEMMDPTGKKIKTKDVIRIISADKHTMEMFHTTDGKESKVMEITYTRNPNPEPRRRGAMDDAEDEVKKAVDKAKDKLPK